MTTLHVKQSTPDGIRFTYLPGTPGTPCTTATVKHKLELVMELRKLGVPRDTITRAVDECRNGDATLFF